MKRTLIVSNAKAKITVKESWLEYETFYESQCIGFSRIKAFYVNKEAHMSMSDLFRLSLHVPVYFIDGNRNILGKISRSPR